MTNTELFTTQVTSCPACGASAWTKSGQVKDYSVSGEWFELRECSHCHLKMTYPQPSPSYIGRYYASENYISHSDTRSGIINKLYHTARDYMMRRKLRWVEKASGMTKGSLLDVGAGTGHFASFMKSNGWTVTAIEPEETARKVALQKLDLVVEPLDKLPDLPPRSFDVITLWHVLEHVHDPASYLRMFHALLKPEGVLMIAVPNYTSKDASAYGIHWAAYDVPRHLWHFSPDAMQELLHRHLFKLDRKIMMPLDAFYVGMLSEKYRGNDLFGPLGAIITGTRTFFSGNKKVEKSSSIIYVARPVT